ncbi:hypothetical protein [Sorangium sp. So ce1389]|uniref:hypothetical protein n=1 Tax=Sorangium sp. So ce1389 TaxID=3133336 RepID=UPI003F62B9CE
MRGIRSIVACSLFGFAVVACGVTTDDVDEGQAQEQEEPTQEADQEIGSQPCGSNTCTGGTVCCNASCGWCVPKGMMCIQIACSQADGDAT